MRQLVITRYSTVYAAPSLQQFPKQHSLLVLHLRKAVERRLHYICNTVFVSDFIG